MSERTDNINPKFALKLAEAIHSIGPDRFVENARILGWDVEPDEALALAQWIQETFGNQDA